MRNARLSRLVAAALSLTMLVSMLLVGASPYEESYDPAKIEVWDFG